MNRLIEVSTGSPLHIELLAYQEEIVELLLQGGADINVRADVDGAAPLHWAAFFSNYAVVALRVAAGADVNASDVSGSTPLDAVLTGSAPRNQPTKDQITDYLRANGGVTRDSEHMKPQASLGLASQVYSRLKGGYWSVVSKNAYVDTLSPHLATPTTKSNRPLG